MKDYYIEVYNPPFPNKGHKVRFYRGHLKNERLSSTLIALYKVKDVLSAQDALAKLLLGQGRTLVSPDAKQLKLV